MMSHADSGNESKRCMPSEITLWSSRAPENTLPEIINKNMPQRKYVIFFTVLPIHQKRFVYGYNCPRYAARKGLKIVVDDFCNPPLINARWMPNVCTQNQSHKGESFLIYAKRCRAMSHIFGTQWRFRRHNYFDQIFINH